MAFSLRTPRPQRDARLKNPTWAGIWSGLVAYLILFGLSILFITHHPHSVIGANLPMPAFLSAVGVGVLVSKRTQRRNAQRVATHDC